MKLEANKEIFKNTCLNKYGVENPSQDPNIKNKKIQFFNVLFLYYRILISLNNP